MVIIMNTLKKDSNSSGKETPVISQADTRNGHINRFLKCRTDKSFTKFFNNTFNKLDQHTKVRVLKSIEQYLIGKCVQLINPKITWNILCLSLPLPLPEKDITIIKFKRRMVKELRKQKPEDKKIIKLKDKASTFEKQLREIYNANIQHKFKINPILTKCVNIDKCPTSNYKDYLEDLYETIKKPMGKPPVPKQAEKMILYYEQPQHDFDTYVVELKKIEPRNQQIVIKEVEKDIVKKLANKEPFEDIERAGKHMFYISKKKEGNPHNLITGYIANLNDVIKTAQISKEQYEQALEDTLKKASSSTPAKLSRPSH